MLLDLDDQAHEEVVRVFDAHREKDAENDQENGHSEDARVGRVAASPDCQWLATADSSGRVCVFNLDSVKVGLSLSHLFHTYLTACVLRLVARHHPPTHASFSNGSRF